ncbi:SUMO-activating enzyme subunit 1B-1 [Cryptomeria japonica]|uniref:SUMO-activating enzyme subunit 1B-1 n=1 Tax=Cryptomeria japonica TaxID=3369 RepID=UPI0025ABA28B|nr:SUMO-activating enzyme subunit 1B-1 [Cryptomeria japonica]
MDGELLTDQETAVYDRQIRVWGVDAQRRLSKSHVLVIGITGVVAELCKNIVLAGVGSLTLMDDSPITSEDLSVGFLIHAGDSKCNGKSIAEVCQDSLRDFNPMVHVSVEKGSLVEIAADFLDNFDAVVLGRASIATKKKVNELCRKRPQRVAFYSVDCRGSCGEIFVDLQNHTYNQKKMENAPLEVTFPSLEEATSVRWSSLPRNTSKLYFAMRVVEMFEQVEGRESGDLSSTDIPSVLKMRKKLCEEQEFAESRIPDLLLQRIVDAGKRELPPVCAIVGGILGQEVIKAMSCKGDPLKNFFFFDVMDGKGIIEDISTGDKN